MIVTRIWKINGKKPLSIPPIAETAQQAGWPMDWYGLANSVSCPRGKMWGEAHFLVSTATLDGLSLDSPVSITAEHEDGETEWQAYYCIRTEAITQDPDTPAHWITLADRRWFFSKASACNKRYNLRNSPTGYITSTTNGGTAYTWEEILEDLWDELPTPGTAPTLPITPGSTPENLIFEGVNAWEAINQVLTAIGCSVCYDPFEDSFSYVELKATQSGLSSLIDANDNRILWEYGPTDLPKSHYPANVVVTFTKLPDGLDAPFASPPETETVSLGQPSFSDTNWPIHDTMFWFDDNSAQRATRASEIKDALIGLLKPMAEPMGRVYAGVVEFTIGSDLTEIVWTSDGARGMRTIIKMTRQEIEWPKLLMEGGGGGEWIKGNLVSIRTASSGTPADAPWTGLVIATLTVKETSPGLQYLIDVNVDMVDKQECVYDHAEADLVGVWTWGKKAIAKSLDPAADPGTLTPLYWAADDRCCVAADFGE